MHKNKNTKNSKLSSGRRFVWTAKKPGCASGGGRQVVSWKKAAKKKWKLSWCDCLPVKGGISAFFMWVSRFSWLRPYLSSLLFSLTIVIKLSHCFVLVDEVKWGEEEEENENYSEKLSEKLFIVSISQHEILISHAEALESCWNGTCRRVRTLLSNTTQVLCVRSEWNWDFDFQTFFHVKKQLALTTFSWTKLIQ